MNAPAPSTIGAVLAGGLGRRLGGAKAAVTLAGRPLISYPLAALAAAGIEAVVVAKEDSELGGPPEGALPSSVPRIGEPAEPRHPLCGIVAALEHAEKRGAEAAIILACDTPLVPPDLLAWLARQDEPLVIPLVDGHPQPLAARYSTALLPELRETLDEAPGALTEIVSRLKPRLLTEDELARFGDPRQILLNVNTPGDLKQAEGLVCPPQAP